ncbi:MAG: N-6 DNA methylase [Emergencia timonensis]|uniref:N-6 DNA methylase n=1 Tax=Emergencia timonensis TaxID=1776384 RepID=UPI0008354A3C|nr:N-6 DNA methylase [Emergencia timonensis]
MKKRVEWIWNQLEKKLTAEQVFYLLLMLLFSSYFEHKLIGHNPDVNLSEGDLRSLFKQVHPAARRFAERVDWNTIDCDLEVQVTIQEVRRTFSYFMLEQNNTCAEEQQLIIEKFDILLSLILELAGNMGLFVATPSSTVHLITKLLRESKPNAIADFCSGSAAVGLKLWKHYSKNDSERFLYCTDIDPILCDIATVNLCAHGVQAYKVEKRDLLANPQKVHPRLFDLLVMDIPRGRNKSLPNYENDPRISDIKISNIYSDWIFIQDALYHLSNHGQAMILATTSTLIRANEKPLREEIILKDWLEAVITLPPNLYSNTRTGTELLIFNKKKRAERQGKILFIDISKYYYRQQRNAYAISEEGLQYACESFLNYRDIVGISAIQETSMLSPNTCSFKPLQYIQQRSELHDPQSVRLEDISKIVRGAQVASVNDSTGNGDAYFINIKDIQDGRIIYETAERIDPAHPAYREKFRICEDDILITSKGTAIKMTIVENDPPLAFISGNITIIRVDNCKYDPYVLFEYLNSETGQVNLDRIQSGTTIKILSNGNLKNLQIPSFELLKMQEVGKQLKENRNEFFRVWRELINNYQEKKKELSELIFKEE